MKYKKLICNCNKIFLLYNKLIEIFFIRLKKNVLLNPNLTLKIN